MPSIPCAARLLAGTVLLCLLTCVACDAVSLPKLWPAPTEAEFGDLRLTLDPLTFSVNLADEAKVSILQRAVKRYKKELFFPFPYSKTSANVDESLPSLVQLRIVVKDPMQKLHLDVSETYQLQIRLAKDLPTEEFNSLPEDSYIALLYAETCFGAIRGLETFSQLLHPESMPSAAVVDFEDDFRRLEEDLDLEQKEALEEDGDVELYGYSISGCPLSIRDTPRFKWRGLLIDTARHFAPLDTILFELDAMSWTKMNVLHWHITDAESFPFESDLVPELREGAWSPEAVYSHEDIRKVVSYAADRGIRVVPEFDMPAHSLSWGKGIPDIILECEDSQGNARHAMDPTNERTYQVIDSVISEAAMLFPDRYLHLGFDEFHLDCWNTKEFLDRSATYRSRNGIGPSSESLLEYFMDRTRAMATERGKKVVVWEEALMESLVHLPIDQTTVEAWRGWKHPLAYETSLNNGYETLLATKWYLDYDDRTWDFFYDVNDENLEMARDHPDIAIGGEACIWAERVDESTMQSKVWPRAGAIAERLWSGEKDTDRENVEARLEAWRCRGHQRGLIAAPLFPDYCPLPPKKKVESQVFQAGIQDPVEADSFGRTRTVVVYQSTGGVGWWLLIGGAGGALIGFLVATRKRIAKHQKAVLISLGAVFFLTLMSYMAFRAGADE